MQVHWKNTKRAKKYRKWFYGDREMHEPQKQKKTRLEILAERRERWEKAHEDNNRNTSGSLA